MRGVINGLRNRLIKWATLQFVEGDTAYSQSEPQQVTDLNVDRLAVIHER